MRSTVSSATLMSPQAGAARSHWLRRPALFIAVGVASAGVQLGILEALSDVWGWVPLWANIVAFVVATQVNFVLHHLLTWHDRLPQSRRELAERWGRFIGTVGSTALINQGIFLLLLRWMPDVVAAATASTLVSGLNYLLGNRIIFSAKQRAVS